MKINAFFIISLVITSFMIFSSTAPHLSRSRTIPNAPRQQISNFTMSFTGPESVESGETFNLTVDVQLKDTVAAASGVLTITLTIPAGMQFAPGYNATVTLGTLNPGEIESRNYSVFYIGRDNSILVLASLFEDGVEQRVETTEGAWMSYADLAIGIRLPEVKIKGPLELGGVVPRLRVSKDEKATITYNVSSAGRATVFNLVFTVISPKTFEIIAITPETVASLAPNESVLVKIEGRCTTDSASTNLLRFLVESDNYDAVEKVIKVETFDWFNVLKYDSALSIIAWPLTIIFLVALGIVMTVYYMKKRRERIRVSKELEERYGKAMLISE